jgi:hypothetical protein
VIDKLFQSCSDYLLFQFHHLLLPEFAIKGIYHNNPKPKNNCLQNNNDLLLNLVILLV